jgi:hypothetical protein
MKENQGEKYISSVEKEPLFNVYYRHHLNGVDRFNLVKEKISGKEVSEFLLDKTMWRNESSEETGVDGYYEISIDNKEMIEHAERFRD